MSLCIGPLRALAVALLATAAAGEIPWLGPNLAPNPGFEEPAPDDPARPAGWQVAALRDGFADGGLEWGIDRTVTCVGDASLRLATTSGEGSVTLTSDLIPVDPDAVYLYAMAGRLEGFNERTDGGEEHQGVGAGPRLFWFDADRKALPAQPLAISRFPYGPSPWDLRDAFETAPADARFVRLGLDFHNHSRTKVGHTIASTIWLDAVQFRRYDPPPTPAWALGPQPPLVEGATDASPYENYFVATDPGFGQRRGGQWSAIVVDPKAERGSAVEVPGDVGPGIAVNSPYTVGLPAGLGLYRIRARVAVMAAAPPGDRLGWFYVNSERTGYRLNLPVSARPDVPVGDYAICEGDFILRDNGWWNIVLRTEGKIPFRVDWIRLIPLARLGDRQLSALYPDAGAELPADLVPPSGRTLRHSKEWLRPQIFAGLGYDWHRPAEAFCLLSTRVDTTAYWTVKGRTASLPNLPESPAVLFAAPLVCLANVRADAIPLAYRRALVTYVERGGALLVLGGHQSYERGALQDSWIEQLLPVEAAPTLADGHLTRAEGWPVRPVPGIDWLAWMPPDAPVVATRLHRVILKPDAQVLLTAGDQPFVVGGDYGKGRVVCVLAWPTGPAPAGTILFPDWDAWPTLLRDLSWWAMRADGS